MKKMKNSAKPSQEDVSAIIEFGMKVQRGSKFVGALPAESDWHYAGKGVWLGEAERPVFWYRPQDSETYRVGAQQIIREAENIGRLVDRFQDMFIEYGRAVIMCKPVGDAVAAVITPDASKLGIIRHKTKKLFEELSHSF